MNNAMSKITRPQIWIIAGVLSLLIGIGFFFGLIKPLNENFDAAEAEYNSKKLIADTRPQVLQKKKDNKKIVDIATNDYRGFEKRFMSYTVQGTKKPIVDTSDLIAAMQQRWQEQTVRLGPLVKNFLEKDKTVRVVQSNLAVPAPPTDPNAAYTKVIELPLGTVTVAGTFDNILRHVDRWNKFNRLIVVDGLSLQGNSPQLVGQYTISCTIFPRADVQGPAVPVAAPSQGGGFGGGGFGGGGYPGGGGGVPGGGVKGAAAQ